MKHIVFVIGNYKNGGVAMHSTNLANYFARSGYKITILVTGSISSDVFFECHKNVDVVHLSDYVSKNCRDEAVWVYEKKHKRKIKTLKCLRIVTRFIPGIDKFLDTKIRYMRKCKDISIYALKNQNSIYITFGVAYFALVLFADNTLKSRIIYAERIAPEKELEISDKSKQEFCEMIGRANGAVLQTKNELEFYGDYLKNATVINNPLKADLPERFIGKRKKVIVNFCRVSEQKNLPLLFDAMQKLHKDYPEYVLKIYGNTVEKHEEELLEEYRQLIKASDAESYIKLLPPSRDVHKLIIDSAMFVSSSDFEGLSNSMIEAMAIGLPCVCTDCLGGGAREMIKDGENGLLVPMNDSEALYLAMKRFIEEPGLLEKCSINAEKKREDLSLPKIAGKWIDYIESII